MQHADGAGEAEFEGAAGHGQGVFGNSYAAAQDRIDVDLKFGVLGEQDQFLVEHLEAFLRSLVGHGVIDADLQVIEAGAIELPDAVAR